MLQDRIEKALSNALASADVVIAHNVLTTHFNLPLTAALHHLVDIGIIRRLVVWCHDLSRYVNPASGERQRTGFPWDLLRLYRTDFTYVAVSSQRQRTLAGVLQCPPEKIRVVPNGVDPAQLLALSDLGQHLAKVFGLLSADLILLMPIRITRAKNIELAMRVTAALKAGGLAPRLVVSGPPDPHAADSEAYYISLKALRQSLDLQEEIVFVYEGTPAHPRPLNLSSTFVAELYRLCDVVLMPSQREGFGLPVLEAGLADKPIFTTAVPALETVGLGCRFLIEPAESPESIAARIVTWAEQDGAHRYRRHIRQRLTWQSIFERSIEPLIRNSAQPAAGNDH